MILESATSIFLIYVSNIFNMNSINSKDDYDKIYKESLKSPVKFWSEKASRLTWFKKWKKISEGKSFSTKWFTGGETNISYNCLDRHVLSGNTNKAALIWEGENEEQKIFTYGMLLREVSLFANGMKKLGVKKGDVVFIYMGMVPEALISMLACARIGAVHSVIFNGLSAEALKNRILLSNPKLLIISDVLVLKGNKIPLKPAIDSIIPECLSLKKIVVHRRMQDSNLTLNSDLEIYWKELIKVKNDKCSAIKLNSGHELFKIHSYDAEGNLIEINHSTGGYMVQAFYSTSFVFGIKEDDLFWCSGDISWITGHTYLLYGPLLNGITTFMYEGIPGYPVEDRYWELIEKYKINILLTTPTTIRAARSLGEDWVVKHDLSSLRLIGTIGEPVKHDTLKWIKKFIGDNKVPVINSYIQTEGGSILLSSLGINEIKNLESFCRPLPGIDAEVVNLKGKSFKNAGAGYLVINNSWPSILKVGGKEKGLIENNYRKIINGKYFTGDAAVKDEHGNISILGRVDNNINVGWHRINSKMIENMLDMHPAVIESAVVARPDDIKGNAPVAFVVLQKGEQELLLLKEELRHFIEIKIGAFAKPDEISFLDSLPKDENKKILRRVLRSIAITGKISGDLALADDFSTIEKLREEI